MKLLRPYRLNFIFGTHKSLEWELRRARAGKYLVTNSRRQLGAQPLIQRQARTAILYWIRAWTGRTRSEQLVVHWNVLICYHKSQENNHPCHPLVSSSHPHIPREYLRNGHRGGQFLTLNFLTHEPPKHGDSLNSQSNVLVCQNISIVAIIYECERNKFVHLLDVLSICFQGSTCSCCNLFRCGTLCCSASSLVERYYSLLFVLGYVSSLGGLQIVKHIDRLGIFISCSMEVVITRVIIGFVRIFISDRKCRLLQGFRQCCGHDAFDRGGCCTQCTWSRPC